MEHRSNRLGRLTSLLLVAGALLGLVGCSTQGGDADPNGGPSCKGDKCDGFGDTAFDHRWAIDMAKVRRIGKYAQQARFVATVPEELGLPEQIFSGACQKEQIITDRNEDGTYNVRDGQCLIYDNVMYRNADHSAHRDDPTHRPIINVIDGENQIDPPGYLNIIALKRAERADQDELRKYLRNGDILVYFHPEDKDTTQYRMHHAAMFYDTGEGPLAIALNGTPYVHHVDNPTSYGPAFNAGASSVPFHVYRFSPNGAPNVGGRDRQGNYKFPCNDSIRGAGGPQACQEGQSFFTITNEMADHYAYMARNWALITNEHAPFADFHSMSWRDAYKRDRDGVDLLSQVDEFARPALQRGETPEVYCAGLVFSNLNLGMNRPLNPLALGDELNGIFQNISVEFDDNYMSLGGGSSLPALTAADLADTWNLPSMGQLVFEPTTASGIIDAWLEGYFGRLPREARAQILMSAAPKLAQGFSSLVWAATKSPNGRHMDSLVATPERIQEYAVAYGQGGAALEAIKTAELENIENRYVPPPMYHWMANRENSVISYVGTVIHVDLLAPIGDNDGDVGNGEIKEFVEGGPDTSLYEHYFIENGGRHAQRILDVSAGPTEIGPGSAITTRISAADIRDVRVVLHPAGTFDLAAHMNNVYLCERNQSCIGDVPGIPVPVSDASGIVWRDVTVQADLFKSVAEGGLGCRVETDGSRTCPSYDWATGAAHPTDRITLGGARGFWTLTVLDRGEASEGIDVPNCAKCSTGGAHSNQWVVKVRNDIPGNEPPPPPGVLLDQTGSAPQGEEIVVQVTVPAGTQNLRFELTTTSGDADLSVQSTIDEESNCSSANSGTEDDVCSPDPIVAGTYDVTITGYEASEYRIRVVTTAN